MVIYSKSYDFTTKVLMNLKISQFIYNNKKIKFPFENFELSLLVKKEMVKTKNKLIVTIVSMLFLLSGVYPLYKLKNRRRLIFCEYIFQCNTKLFFLLDIALFIMYHYMKKSHEVVRKIKGGEKYEIHYFHMYNISMIKTFDPYLSLFPDTNVISKITNNASDTKDAKFVEAILKL